MTWRNRIVGYEERDPRGLAPNAHNWRRHPARQAAAMRAALTTMGWVAPIVVNQPTGRIVDGHLRCELAAKAGMATVPVVLVALTDEEERAALATIDPLGDLALADDDALGALLDSLGDCDLLAALSDSYDLAEDAHHDAQEAPGEAQDDGGYEDPEDDPGAPQSAPNAEQQRYPLAVVLTQADYRTWQAYKQRQGLASDSAAFLRLLSEVG